MHSSPFYIKAKELCERYCARAELYGRLASTGTLVQRDMLGKELELCKAQAQECLEKVKLGSDSAYAPTIVKLEHRVNRLGIAEPERKWRVG